MRNSADTHPGPLKGLLQIGPYYATYNHRLMTHDMQPRICRAEGGPGTGANNRYADTCENMSIHAGTIRRVPVPYVELGLGYSREFGGGGYDRKAAVKRMLSTYPKYDGLMCVHSASLEWEEAC
jgi:hypothetical protein